uniref:Chloride channel protein n=1 Tax=Rhabditophanes sp. KR3021 TaxID=114890 RepID=A0AC35U5I4_9BILA
MDQALLADNDHRGELPVHSRFTVEPTRASNANDIRERKSLLLNDHSEDVEADGENGEDSDVEDDKNVKKETFKQFVHRHARNVANFLVEDWAVSAMLGIITAILSISMDVAIEYLLHLKVFVYEKAFDYNASAGFITWISYITVLVTLAALFCEYVSKQAVGSGIPEVKVIMNGFTLHNYLTFRTLVAKIVGLTLTLGSGLPVGKEGPFVHMGAIVGTLLTKMTRLWQSKDFYMNNEGRAMEILSSGCASGISCQKLFRRLQRLTQTLKSSDYTSIRLQMI